jgi:hypothetical protein
LFDHWKQKKQHGGLVSHIIVTASYSFKLKNDTALKVNRRNQLNEETKRSKEWSAELTQREISRS